MTHVPEHDELLERALTGDAAARGALDGRLRSCAECARIWSTMNDIDAALEGTRRELPGDLEVALGPGPAPGAERVLATLRKAAGGRVAPAARAASPLRTRRVLVALAAGVLLLLAGWGLGAWLRHAPSQEPTVPLGPDDFEILEPRDNVEHIERFAWSHALGARGWYELEIEAFDAATASWQSVEHGAGRVRTNEWRPAAALASEWPQRLRWRVLAMDPGADPVASRWTEFVHER